MRWVKAGGLEVEAAMEGGRGTHFHSAMGAKRLSCVAEKGRNVDDVDESRMTCTARNGRKFNFHFYCNAR